MHVCTTPLRALPTLAPPPGSKGPLGLRFGSLFGLVMPAGFSFDIATYRNASPSGRALRSLRPRHSWLRSWARASHRWLLSRRAQADPLFASSSDCWAAKNKLFSNGIQTSKCKQIFYGPYYFSKHQSNGFHTHTHMICQRVKTLPVLERMGVSCISIRVSGNL